jgi:AraC-like DNA-binding protein
MAGHWERAIVIEQFSTSRVCADQRLSYWNELMAETYSGLVVDPRQPHFRAQMSRWYLGDLTMICPRSSAVSVTRMPSRGRVVEDMVILHIVQSGLCSLRQRGSEVVLKPGDMVVCSSVENYQLETDGDHQVLVVELPRQAIVQCNPQLDDRIATRISGHHAATRLLYSYLLSLWREGAANFDEAMGDAYACILKEMFARSLDIASEADVQSGGALFKRMQGIVEAQLADCALSPAALANELGVSLRTLQSAAAEMGTTPTAYITDRRLTRSSERLVLDQHLSVTQIAYDCGFSDSAYFSRRFHGRFGVSPKQYRARH